MMTRSIVASGPTEESAIASALETLGVARDAVTVEVLSPEDTEEGSESSPGVRVRVTIAAGQSPDDAPEAVSEAPDPNAADPDAGGDAAAPASAADQEDDLLEDQADAAEDFLNGLLDILDMDGDAEAEFEDDGIIVELAGPNMAVLIGRHGATLEALQDLTRAAVQQATGARVTLNLDIEGYRARQQSIMERKARAAAARVRETGQPVRLEPMSSFERKLVHNALVAFPEVSTSSEGEEPERYVVISPA